MSSSTVVLHEWDLQPLLGRLAPLGIEWPWAASAPPLASGDTPSPWLEPHWADITLRRLAQQYAGRPGDAVYVGGYAEDRRDVWRGSYLTPERAIHLGVDIQAAVGAAVYAPRDGVLVDVWTDPDQNGGWGGRVVLGLADDHRLLVAHLDLDGETLGGIGESVTAGQRLGWVAPAARNGGWFPHVHLQTLTAAVRLDDVDGYGTAGAIFSYPDPRVILGWTARQRCIAELSL